MYYPQELIDQIQQNNDIVDVINEYIPLIHKGSNYVALCPFHQDSNPSLTVNRQKQIFKCFVCGEGGNVFSFLQKYDSKTFPEAVETLASRAGIKLPERSSGGYSKENQDRKLRLIECNTETARYYYALLRNEKGKSGFDYFKNRELSDETMKQFGLGFSGVDGKGCIAYLKNQGFTDKEIIDAGVGVFDEKNGLRAKFWNRVMFPIKNQAGKVIGFGGRVMGKAEPKYLNTADTPVFDKSSNLYAFDIFRSSRSPYIILCEGYMDVIALHQAGFNMACASLGTAFTPGQANLIRRYVKDVYLSYDSDGPGVKAAIRAAKICREYGLSCKVIDMNPHKDPDEFIKDLGKEEFQKRIDEAKNAFIFEIGVIRSKYDPSDPDANTRYDQEVAALLAEMKDEVVRTNYIKACAKEMGISTEKLSEMVADEARTLRKFSAPVKTKSGIHEKKDEAKIRPQQLMMTFLAEFPSVYPQIEKYVTADDFPDEPYKTVAEKFLEDIKNGNASPARMVNMFEDEEVQNEVADMFTGFLNGVESKEEKEAAIVDIIYRLKVNSLEEKKKSEKGIDPREFMLKKKELNDIKKIKIQIPG